MDGDQDGQAAAPPRVRFGPRPTQDMPLDWAEAMLSSLREKNPKLFGQLLQAAAIDDQAAAP